MEALANVNQFGVCELREDALMLVDGGVDPFTVIATCYLVSYAAGKAVAHYNNSSEAEKNAFEHGLKVGVNAVL